ncbi:MAG: hypothetical protein AABY07_02800, partial [Nanoarchaeota archaeon]
CKNGGGGSPPPEPGNSNPTINTSSLPDAEEGRGYSELIDVTGEQPLTINISGPIGMNNSSDPNRILWSFPTAKVDPTESHPVSIEVVDNSGRRTSKSLSLKVFNKYDNISGSIKDILFGTPITDFDIDLEEQIGTNFVFYRTFSIRNSQNGSYVLQGVPKGKTWRVTIGDFVGQYNRHRAGIITTNEDVSGVDFELIPNTFDLAFFDEIARNPNVGGQTRRLLSIPTIYINRNPAFGSGIQPNQAEIALIVSVFREDAKRFNNNFTLYGSPTDIGSSSPLPFTNAIVIGTNPPNFGTPGFIRAEWDDDLGGSPTALGANGVYPQNGDEITSSFVLLRTGLTGSQQRYVYRQESMQVFGARNDIQQGTTSFYPATSIFDDPQTIDFLAQKDLDLGKILYKRPPGNRSVNGIPDANPDTYRIR